MKRAYLIGSGNVEKRHFTKSIAVTHFQCHLDLTARCVVLRDELKKAAFDMWNVSVLSMEQTLTCKMTCEIAIFFLMIGLHSTHVS